MGYSLSAGLHGVRKLRHLIHAAAGFEPNCIQYKVTIRLSAHPVLRSTGHDRPHVVNYKRVCLHVCCGFGSSVRYYCLSECVRYSLRNKVYLNAFLACSQSKLWLSTRLKHAVCLSTCFCLHFFSLLQRRLITATVPRTSTIFLTTCLVLRHFLRISVNQLTIFP
jgi:hypothetical protein